MTTDYSCPDYRNMVITLEEGKRESKYQSFRRMTSSRLSFTKRTGAGEKTQWQALPGRGRYFLAVAGTSRSVAGTSRPWQTLPGPWQALPGPWQFIELFLTLRPYPHGYNRDAGMCAFLLQIFNTLPGPVNFTVSSKQAVRHRCYLSGSQARLLPVRQSGTAVTCQAVRHLSAVTCQAKYSSKTIAMRTDQ